MKTKQSKFNLSTMLIVTLAFIILGTISVMATNTLITQSGMIVDEINTTDLNLNVTSGDGINVQNAGNAESIDARKSTGAGQSGGVARFEQSNGLADREVAAFIQEGNGSAVTAGGVYIRDEGNRIGLLIDKNGNGKALQIDSEATSQSAVVIDLPSNTTSNKPVINIDDNSGGCSAGAYGFYSYAGDLYWCKNGASTKLN